MPPVRSRAVLILLSLSLLAQAPAASPVRFGLIPSIAHERMEAELQPVADFIAKRIHRKVELVPAKDYDEIGRMLESRRVDFAILFPLAFAQAMNRTPPVQLLGCSVRQGKPSYRGYFLTRQDSTVRTLQELKGKRIGFVNEGSTSGYLFPVQVLINQKLIASEAGLADFFAEIRFLGSHDAVLHAVERGEVDAGTVFDLAIAQATRDGLDSGVFRVIGRTAEIPHEAVVSVDGVDAVLRDRFKEALLSLDTRTSEGRAVLRPMTTDMKLNGFVDCNEDVFKPVRDLVSP